MTILDFFVNIQYGDPTWPPKILKEDWDAVKARRMRFRNDYGEMLQHTPEFNKDDKRRSIYTPLPMAREMARLSSALLFSDPVKVTLPDEEEKIRRERVVQRQKEKDARNPFLNTPTPVAAEDEEPVKPEPPEAPETSGEGDSEAPKPTAALREPPKQSKRQKLLERLLELNELDAFLQECGEKLAVEGRGAIRVIRDEDVAEGMPFFTWVPEDQILWDERHGRAVVGATAIFEYSPAVGSAETETREVFRMFEEHTPGSIVREVFKGTVNHLGKSIGPGEWPEVWRGTKPYLETGLDSITMCRWDNVPGGYADIEGVEALLDTLDEAESLMVDKGRKSIPKVFADRSLADENGQIDAEGITFVGQDNMAPEHGTAATDLIQTVQPELQSQEHLEWISHIREMIATNSGYSNATWGIGEQGRTDSGTALQLREARTLLTKAGKDRMARGAIQTAVAVALAWADTKPSPAEAIKRDTPEAEKPEPVEEEGEIAANPGVKVREYRPEVMLGDGLPRDTKQKAEEIATLLNAGAISLRQAVRELHPDWTEDQVDEEVEEIEDTKAPAPMVDAEGKPVPPTAPGAMPAAQGEKKGGGDTDKIEVKVT